MALLLTTEELQPYFPARLTLAVEDLLPGLLQVEQVYLRDQVLGRTLYEALHQAYQDDALTPELDALHKACLPAVVNLAIHDHVGISNVELGSGGLQVASNEDRKPAAEWRTRDFERAVFRSGIRGLDNLLTFLRRNADDYPDWTASPQHALVKSLVPTPRTMSKYVDIGNSGWLFWRMMAVRDRIEGEQIKDAICSSTLYDLLRTESAEEDNWTGNNGTLAALARPALCHLTLAASILELALNKDERGIWTFEALTAGQTSTGPKGTSDDRLNALVKNHERLGQSYLQKLKDKLYELAKAGNLATYASTDCYTAQAAAEADPEPSVDPNAKVGGML